MGVVEQVKDIAKLAQDIHSIPLYEKLIAMTADLMTLVDDKARLHDEVRELRASLALREEMTFEGNLYWRTEGAERGGPFCPKCFHVDSSAVRMLSFPDWNGEPYACPACAFIVDRMGGAVPVGIAGQITASLGIAMSRK